MIIRPELPADREAIRRLVDAAFATAPHAGGTEAAIVDGLRAAGALTLSLVATDDGAGLLGHVAFSPVTIGGSACGWFGLGPVAVRPDRQGRGIGTALIRAGLARLRIDGAGGCVVLGEPSYYARFGFMARAQLRLPGVPPAYFRSLPFRAESPTGVVAFNPAFQMEA